MTNKRQLCYLAFLSQLLLIQVRHLFHLGPSHVSKGAKLTTTWPKQCKTEKESSWLSQWFRRGRDFPHINKFKVNQSDSGR